MHSLNIESRVAQNAYTGNHEILVVKNFIQAASAGLGKWKRQSFMHSFKNMYTAWKKTKAAKAAEFSFERGAGGFCGGRDSVSRLMFYLRFIETPPALVIKKLPHRDWAATFAPSPMTVQ